MIFAFLAGVAATFAVIGMVIYLVDRSYSRDRDRPLAHATASFDYRGAVVTDEPYLAPSGTARRSARARRAPETLLLGGGHAKD